MKIISYTMLCIYILFQYTKYLNAMTEMSLLYGNGLPLICILTFINSIQLLKVLKYC